MGTVSTPALCLDSCCGAEPELENSRAAPHWTAGTSHLPRPQVAAFFLPQNLLPLLELH